MNPVRSFEDLWIWQQARRLVKDVYTDFGESTPSARDFGFRGQVQKAAVSIMNNIAEGFERRSDPDFARFLDIAKGSCAEVRSMYYTAEDLRYVVSEIASNRRKTTKRIAGGIASLRAHLKGSESRGSKSRGSKVEGRKVKESKSRQASGQRVEK